MPTNDDLAGTLSMDERRSLRCLAGLMIPASPEYRVPGADDDTIFADIVASLGRDAAAVGEAMRYLNALAGGVFADLPPARRACRRGPFSGIGRRGGARGDPDHRAVLLP